MLKKELTPREKAIEEAKKRDKETAEKTPVNKAKIFKDFLSGVRKEE